MNGILIYDLIRRLFKIPRSITGDGVRLSLNLIKEEYLSDLTIHEVSSGEEIEDWTVPNEWNLMDAYIKDAKGNVVISIDDTNLHVVGYSASVDKYVNLDELSQHLYSIPEIPSAVPYVTSYYNKVWGFCMSHDQRTQLVDQRYHVFIDTAETAGSLTYADMLIKGKEDKEIFFSTYICHPQMANNELSGPSLATYLAKWVSERSNRFTYRFCFVPETIGSIAYIAKNKSVFEKTYAAFNLTCVGDEKGFSFMPSRKGDTVTDRVARHVIHHQSADYIEYSFIKDRGSDERQYCSPGVDLPMISLMKSKYGEFPEYHTSLDNLDFVTPNGLEHSFQVHTACLEILENNFRYKSNILGEPFLSKRGKNYLIVGGKQNADSKSAQIILDIMACCDGTLDLIDLAEEIDYYALDLIPIINSLEADGLISPVS
jgi:aminopeptidase-like protein